MRGCAHCIHLLTEDSPKVCTYDASSLHLTHQICNNESDATWDYCARASFHTLLCSQITTAIIRYFRVQSIVVDNLCDLWQMERCRASLRIVLVDVIVPRKACLWVTCHVSTSRFPCWCVLSYFSLVFVMEHNWQIQVVKSQLSRAINYVYTQLHYISVFSGCWKLTINAEVPV